MDKLQQALKKYFGHDDFRPGQREIISAIIKKKHVLAVLPTGGGKSLCYQLPALTADRFSIVVSPLIALMKDQVDQLNRNEKVAAFINSTLSYQETEEVLRNISFGTIRLLYLAPEKLEAASFAERIRNLSPEYLFVDEAHCISEWGHSFRPSYRKIKEFAEFTEVEGIAAFTATATPEVVEDIIAQLGLNSPEVFIKGFQRDNLTLKVLRPQHKKLECFDLINHYKTPAIIYAASRKRTEEIAAFLNLYKMNAACYHAGLPSEQRKFIQDAFIEDKIKIIVATNAFGMGIDKKDIRLIIHYNMPASIENYYQEIGRAGRDGKDAYAFLLYDDSDVNIHKFFINSSYPGRDLIIGIYNAICDSAGIALGSPCDKEIPLNPAFISSYIKQEISSSMLSSAVTILEQAGYLKSVSEFHKKHYLMFNLQPDKLKEYIKNLVNNSLKEIIILLLREYGSSLFNIKAQIFPEKLASAAGVSVEYVDDNLMILHNTGIAEYYKPPLEKSVLLANTRVNEKYLILDNSRITRNFQNALLKLDKMVEFAYTTECRLRFIVNYFGEKNSGYSCHKCDNCAEHEDIQSPSFDYLSEIILQTVEESDSGISEKKLMEVLTGSAGESMLSKFSNHGACSNYSQGELKTALHALITKGHLSRETRTKIQITSYGKEQLRSLASEDTFMKAAPAPETEFDYEDNLELFNKLKEVRTESAVRFQQAAYIICPDEVLRAISELKPQSPSELLGIKGFNNRMYNKSGARILEVIKEHQKEKSTEKKEKPKEVISGITSSKGKDAAVPANISETYRLMKKGLSLKDIAALRKLSEAVISMQVETIIELYPDISIDSLFDRNDVELAATEIKKGYSDLRDLKSRLPDHISYPLIRITAAKMKTSRVRS